jgi:hypothetical protein
MIELYLFGGFVMSVVVALHLVAAIQTSCYTKECRDLLRQIRDRRQP